jgi:ATP-binding cassette subfamily B protein
MRMHARPTPLRSATALGQMNLRRTVGFLAPYWPLLLLLLGAVGLNAALGLVAPLLVRGIIDDALAHGNARLLAWLAVGVAGAALASGLVGVARSYLNTLVSQRIMFDLRLRMFATLQRQSLRFFTESRTGELMSRLTSDINGIDTVVSGTMVSIFQNVLILTTTLAAMIAMDWRLTVIALALLPWLIVPTLTVGRMRRRLRSERQAQSGALNALMAESLGISGLMLIKTFTREGAVLRRFTDDARALMRLQVRETLVGRWYFMLLFLVSSGGPALLYWTGGLEVISGALTLGTIIAFVALLGRLYGPATDLMSLHVDVVTSAAYFERIFEYLDLEPDIADAPGAVPLPRVRGRIEYRDVRVEYTPGRPVLDGLNLAVEPGQMAALVGPSGAGKTTITYLLPRLYEPVAGAVLVDGHDVRTVTLESLRAQVGYVSQETFLFHDTVAANLRLARPDATAAEMRAACRAASVLEVVEALPEGFETVVGERGYRLSGGEKQRLAIARMFLKDPAILVLDEATSSLDSHAERAVKEALAALTAGRTTLVIAHRLSTVLEAGIIFFVADGAVAERGTHEELLALDGRYAALYREQFAATAGAPEPAAP